MIILPVKLVLLIFAGAVSLLALAWLYMNNSREHDTTGHNVPSFRRNLRPKKDPGPLDPVLLGSRSVVQNRSVYGAIIMSEYGESNLELTKTWRDSETGKTMTASEMSAIRTRHARDMCASLPFPVVEWPAVFTRPCPQYRVGGHKTERGLALAHYQIWIDFIFFDNDVLHALSKSEVKGSYASTSWSSSSGTFSAFENGTLLRNGIPFLEDDIIVIFEDDADIAVIDINTTIAEELSSMTTDILYLGWCDGRAARPVPLCAHAYALTRRGARRAVQYFEPCGLALDEQLVIMGKNKWLSYRTAHSWSYKNKFKPNYPKDRFTFGMFHQKRMGSFNGH